jgi:hypothetical protein
MPDDFTGDPSFVAVHQAAGVLRELRGLPIEGALRLLQVVADVMGRDVTELACSVVEANSRGSRCRRS